ncbi:MAG TPA: NAD-dependent epimerase/dehydratase family protein, partial [Gemmataceae bacterium]|nr:NAD-dependent epimerase/dehydratase family protein [Gemmataceae bacterium]
MAVCLITGGAGFIGSHLAEALVARGDSVRILDNFSSGTMDNLAKISESIELIAADVHDKTGLKRAVRGVEHIFHFTAPDVGQTTKGADVTPGKWAFATDTLKVLMAAREVGVRRLIFASSSAVYGPGRTAELKESDPIMPVSPYGFAKQTGENQCAGFTLLYGLETVRLRFFNVFGPRQAPTSFYCPAIPVILRTMLAGQSPEIVDSPFEQQDFLYVADAVHAALLAAEGTRVAGKVYNIARGRTTSLVQVVNAANQILGTNIKPHLADTRPLSELVRSVNISRAEAELGF